MTLKRMMMTVLMMLITVSAMSAEQKIWLRYSSGGKAKISLDGKGLELDKENKVTVKDAAGLKVAVTATPDDGYTVSSVTAQLSVTLDDGNSKTRGADDASFIEVTKASNSDTYTFTMPEESFNVVINVTFESSAKGNEPTRGTDYSGMYYLANNNSDNFKGYDNADNFYLCPGEVYYNDGAVATTDNGKPLMTTFKTKQTDEALWIVEKVAAEGYTDYYTFKQKASENTYKYLTVHNKLTDYGNNRMRVHLEEIAPADLSDRNYFSITDITEIGAIKGYSIGCVDAYKDGNNQYLNPADGNKNQKTPTSEKNNTGGMVGFYTKGTTNTDAKGSVWFFEVPKPTIRFNSDNKIEITYVDNSATIYYTTTGDEPPTSGTEHIYSEPFDPDNDVTTIKAYAVVNGKVSTLATYEPAFFLGSTHKYIIQSNQYQFYNLIPNLSVDENTKNVSTLNVPCETMAWHFEYAEDGYYYIVDKNGWYLYYTTTDNSNKYVYLKSSKDDSDDGYKFSITAHASGGFNIIPKGQTTPVNGTTVGLTPAKIAGGIGDTTSRWDIFPYSAANLPQWADAPFTNVSDNNHTYYYKIVSVSQPTMPIILNNDGAIKSQTIPDGIDDRKTIWVIKKVVDDDNDLLDFYTFENAYTGQKLYYNGKGKNYANNVLQLGQPSETGANEHWSHFVIAQTVGGYNIIPRPIVDNTKAINTTSNNEAFNCINRRGGGDILGTYYDDGNGSRWTFSQFDTPVNCMDPVITLDNDNAKFSMSCPTNAAKIYYTLNGDEPVIPIPESDPTTYLYSDASYVPLTSSVVKIIAVAATTADGSDKSSKVTKEKVVLPTITINADNSVTIASTTEGATIYYKLGGDDPTMADGIQSATIASILPSQGPIKAFAAKDEWINSNIATESSIPVKTIEVNSTNASLTSTDPVVYNGTAQEPAFIVKDGESTIGSGEYNAVYSNNTNAGENSATVTITDNGDGDYNVSGSFTFSIEKKPVTINGIKVNEKTYDGTTAATFDCTEAVIGGKIEEDALTITATGVFASKDVVISEETVQPIEVAISKENLTLGGEAVENYKLADDGHQTTASAKINPALLTITANDKTISYGEAPTNDGVTFGEDDGEGGTKNSFVNSETISDLVGELSYAYNSASDGSGESYTTTILPGTFYIIPSGVTSTNYSITFKYGTLTVGKKVLNKDEEGTPADDITVDVTKNSDGDYVVTVMKGGQALDEGVSGGDEKDFTWSSTSDPNSNGVDVISISGHGNYDGIAKARYVNLNFYDDTPNEPQTETAAVYYTTENLQSVGEIEAWYVSAVDAANKIIIIQKVEAGDEKVNYIPANQPLLLLGDETSKGFMLKPYTGTKTVIAEGANLLKRAPSDGFPVTQKGYYVFHEGEFVLSIWGGSQKISAGHFYVNLTGSPAPTRMAIVKSNANTRTGINGISEDVNTKTQNETWYTIDGRRLSRKPTQKGIYITNNRKVIIK